MAPPVRPPMETMPLATPRRCRHPAAQQAGTGRIGPRFGQTAAQPQEKQQHQAGRQAHQPGECDHNTTYRARVNLAP